MRYKITGDNLQIVTLEIESNEMIYAEAGAMVHISGNVNMEAKARGGVMKGLKRMLTGETFFMTQFTSQGGKGIAAFAGNAPGNIKPIELKTGKDFLTR
jgi:uncharacterized protein (AIM24 family)